MGINSDLIKDAIKSGFIKNISQLYSIFNDAIIMAAGDLGKMAEAEERFKKGISIAEQNYDKAKELAGVTE